MNLDFEILFFYLLYLRSQKDKSQNNLVRLQMIKVGYLHDRQITWNSFVGKVKDASLKCEHFTKFCDGCMRFWPSRDQYLIFVVCFKVVELILFLQNIKISSLCQNLPTEAKLQTFIKMQMTRNQPKTFQNRRIFRELNNVTLEKMPSKLIRQTLFLTCSVRAESLHTSSSAAVGLLQS